METNSTSPFSQSGQASLYDLMKMVLANDSISTADKVLLIDELRKNNPSSSDRWTYRLAIYILGAGVLAAIGLIGSLAFYEYDVPESLVAIGSTIAGGVVGVLSPKSGPANNKL